MTYRRDPLDPEDFSDEEEHEIPLDDFDDEDWTISDEVDFRKKQLDADEESDPYSDAFYN